MLVRFVVDDSFPKQKRRWILVFEKHGVHAWAGYQCQSLEERSVFFGEFSGPVCHESLGST